MKKSTSLIITLATISIFHTQPSLACEMSKDPRLNYFSSYEKKQQGVFADQVQGLVRPASIDKCKSPSGKFLMLGLALKSSQLNSDVRDKSYNGIMLDDQCQLINSPIEREPIFTERQAYFSEQFKLMRACTFIQVTERNGRPLVFPDTQNFCKITKITNSTAKLEGDACFLRVQPYYELAVGIAQNPECTDPTFLTTNKLSPRDLDLSLDAYLTGDPTGLSTNLDPIGSQAIRYALIPSSKILKLSEDLGDTSTSWPTTYSVEIHQGPILVRSSGEDRLNWDLQLTINNFIKSSCAEGICASSSDFSQPVVGFVTLKDARSGKPIDDWMIGSYAPANWQGILKGMYHISEGYSLAIGREYELDVEFVDPTQDFIMWLQSIEQTLIDLKKMSGVAGIDVIAPLVALAELLPIPPLQALPSLSGGEVGRQIDQVLQQLKTLRIGLEWPPFYESMCEGASQKCRRIGRDKFLLRLKTRFKITGVDAEQNFIMGDIQTTRESPFFISYSKKVDKLPSVSCPTR